MDSSESDVVVWAESEERHAWWCEVLGIAVTSLSLTDKVGELPASGAQPAMRDSARACRSPEHVGDAA